MNLENRIGRWSVILGIMIVLNLFFNYALSLVYESPEYNNFCPMEQVVTIPDNQTECTDKGGQWTDNQYYTKPVPAPVGVNEPRGYPGRLWIPRVEGEDFGLPYGSLQNGGSVSFYPCLGAVCRSMVDGRT